MNPSYVELDRLFEEIDPDKDSEISAYESYFADLHIGLHDQLVGQYLRAPNAKHGIYLLFYNGEKSNWQPTDHASRLDWLALLADLQASANRVRSERLDIEQLVVVGIDLRPPMMGVGVANHMDA